MPTVPINKDRTRTKRGVLHPPSLLEDTNTTFILKMHISRLLLTLLPFSDIALAIPIYHGLGAGMSTVISEI